MTSKRYPPWDFRNLISMNPIPIQLAVESLSYENLKEIVRSLRYLKDNCKLTNEICYIFHAGIINGIVNYSYPISNLELLCDTPELYLAVIIGLETVVEKEKINYGDTYHHYCDDCNNHNIINMINKFKQLLIT